MGRPRRSASEWAELLEEWSRSGQSISQFAAARGVNARTLGWWRWKLGATLPEPEAPAFLEVVVGEPAPEFIVEVEDAIRIRVPQGFDAAELRRLVAALC